MHTLEYGYYTQMKIRCSDYQCLSGKRGLRLVLSWSPQTTWSFSPASCRTQHCQAALGYDGPGQLTSNRSFIVWLPSRWRTIWSILFFNSGESCCMPFFQFPVWICSVAALTLYSSFSLGTVSANTSQTKSASRQTDHT